MFSKSFKNTILPKKIKQDSNIIKQLCFRESLLISDADQPSVSKNKEVKPLAVGGMCLKIELAQGLETIRQNVPVKEMERNIKERIKQLKKELAQQSPDDNESDEEKLKKYEEFLQEETAKAPLKLLVHLSSEFSHLGQNAGSRIVSWVDKDFHTLEERRTELSIVRGLLP